MNTKDIEIIESKLHKLIDEAKTSSDQKRIDIYLDWLKTKTDLFECEKTGLVVNKTNLPTHINKISFDYLSIDKKSVVSKYYVFEEDKYVINDQPIPIYDCRNIYSSLVLVKRNIVWIEFGCNIGCEFGGKHPAVILKNLGNVLIVCPISSDNGKLSPIATAVELDSTDVYDLPSQRKRFTDITRLTPVSILRVDVNSKPGSLKSNKFKEILNKIKDFYK